MKIGFFGGSFNPPTKAHINLAKEAIESSKLDKLVFVPMGDTYQKIGLAKAEDRLKMLEIACKSAEESKFEISDIEIKMEKRISAIDAFRLIQKEYPKDENFFIMGADNFVNILNWEESEELINKYKYIVFERKEVELAKYIEENEILRNHKENITIFQNKKHKHVSSSRFRTLNDEEIIQKEVLEYIRKKEIY